MTGGSGALFDEGRKLYEMLLAEATDLLRNLGRLDPEGVAEVLERRQSLVDALQDFDARFRPVADSPGGAEFRAFREEITREILAVDGLVIGLAQDKQQCIRAKSSSIAKSASVGRAYDAHFGTRSHLRTSM
ncbi:hypothetical protein GMST_13690 [Geomonas silvestris]|uniref:Flagellar protein FliT n=1 Tax=Geomonas silvestris TaxID=2740184 RepID=A0A6V8MGK2_9BACT|nr:hypothetical protein [Geomonas silvestris]GFO59044.1 hypothetical protein GMST_13690 [Geomonas silvestris]